MIGLILSNLGHPGSVGFLNVNVAEVPVSRMLAAQDRNTNLREGHFFEFQ